MNPQTANKKILIVDDNQMNLMLTSKILESFGFEVVVADSGSKALDMMDEVAPSLILLDISMPEMDGYEVCERIKADKKWKEIPIVFLTANTLTEDLVKGFQKGGVDYMTKPFKSEELFVRVTTHLELAESRKKIIEMNQSRDKLYSIIAHDIRSPLSAIQQTVDAIDQGYFDPASEDFKEIIHHLNIRTKETSTLLTSLLQWTRLQDNKIVIVPRQNSMLQILLSCVELLKPNAQQKGITIELDAHDETVWCDEVSMHTVFRNLISNSIKFSKEEGIIQIKTNKNIDSVSVSVSDTGLGMSPEIIERIFNKNEHYSSSGTQNEQGTGLGLMLVKDFVEKNFAKLNVQSMLGEGTTITIDIPLNNPIEI